MALIVPILTSFDGIGIKRAVADFKRLKTTGEKTGFVISKAFLPAVGALAGLAVAAGKAVQAAIADEAAQASLARTLRVTANATDATVISVEKYISSLGKQLAITDDEARPALATLVLATKDVAKAQELMAIAIDTAAATGKPLADVSEAMSKGFAGNTKSLKQLSPELFKLIKDGASVAEIFEVMKANFGGAGAEAAGTTAGQMKILQIQLKETQEAIGVALLPVLEALLPLLQRLGNFFENNTPFVVGMGVAIGGFAAALVLAKIAMGVATIFGYNLAASLTAVQIATGIGIIAVGIGVAAFIAYKKTMSGVKEEAEKAAKALDGLGEATAKAYEKTKSAVENEEKSAVAVTLARLAILAKTAAEKAAAAATAAAAKKIADAAQKLSEYTSALQGFGSAQKAATDAVKALGIAQLAQGNAIDDLRVAQDKFNKVSQGYGAGSKEAKDATKNLAQAQRDATRASIAQRKAVQDVTDAQQALDDLKSGKATNRATEDLASATAQVADAQRKLDAAYIQGGQDTIGDAVGRLNDAYDKQKQATDAVREAQDASDPASIAKAEDDLTTAKLDLIEQTLAQDEANQFVIDSQKLLDEAISGAAPITDVYKEAQKELASALKGVADANDDVTQSLLDRMEAERELANAKSDLGTATKGTTKAQRKSAAKRTGVDTTNYGFGFSGLTGVAMAKGGIVNKPTIAMIGEAGAEAVVPLDKMNNGSTFNITVNAGVGDPVAIGREVVSVLQAYQRRSGAIPIKVA